MQAVIQPKTVKVASLGTQPKASLPKPAGQIAAGKKLRKSFLDYLRIALSVQVA